MTIKTVDDMYIAGKDRIRQLDFFTYQIEISALL